MDRYITSCGDDELSDRYSHHFLDVITDDEDNILEHAVHQYLEFLRSSGELGPGWMEENMGILTDDVISEFEKYLQSRMEEMFPDDDDRDGSGLYEEKMTEGSMSKCLKTRSCDEGVRDDEICVVCQDLLCKEKMIGALGCGHEYHVPCIEQWLRENNLCPLCRAKALHEKDD